jgi:CDP-diacylglycerol--glycerol-3-phosphate 3-phosphatidyltransferase
MRTSSAVAERSYSRTTDVRRNVLAAQALGIGLLLLFATAGLLATRFAAGQARLFLVGALPLWLLVLALLVALGRQERHQGRLGLATQLTLARGLLLAALAGFAAQAPSLDPRLALLPGLLYTTAALIDLVDGYVARRRGEESALGARLDVAVDALGLVVGPLAAVALGRLPAFYLLVGSAYYLFHGGLWLRRRLKLAIHPLPASRTTRMYAGYQMGLVATVLFPVVGPPGTIIAAAVFMLPTLGLFARDWLVVTGALAARPPAGIDAPDPPGVWPALLLVRAAAAGGIAALVLQHRLPAALLLLALALLLGVATRLSAYAAAVFLTRAVTDDATALPVAALLATLVALLAGGGRAALLREDRWLLMRAGERPGDVVASSPHVGSGNVRAPLPVVEEDRR